jgi:SAM-dependent methyltransferase
MIDLLQFDRVLDVGGWFKPNNSATHVVDLMPYETRGAALHLDPQPGERFKKDTWLQANFLDLDFRLPFEDDYFDFVTCGHTVEDLTNPVPLLDELSRIGKRGLIECPSRLHEQTIGVRDRQSTKCGHPHHHWIVDSDGVEIALHSKMDSRLDKLSNQVPLTKYEALCRISADASNVQYEWKGDIRYSIITGPTCAEIAHSFAWSLGNNVIARVNDAGLRFGRRLRSHGRKQDDWWERIVEQSRPFSKIPIAS